MANWIVKKYVGTLCDIFVKVAPFIFPDEFVILLKGGLQSPYYLW